MERFVISTGRCGSTLLSTMLSCHPDGLILSEFLNSCDRTNNYKPGLVTGEELKSILSRSVPFFDMTVRRGDPSPEKLCEVNDDANFSMPGILVAALPFLTDDPEALYTDIIELVETFPARALSEHYLELFSWLQNKFNKAFWIERSGGIIENLPQLYGFFPNAKYLHIHRDGPENVLSMSKHSYFRTLVSFFNRPATREELENTEYGGKTISAQDPITKRMFQKMPSYEDCATYWNFQLARGYSVLSELSPEQYMEVRFEDLIAEPRNALKKIAEFFELPSSPGWIDMAVAKINVGILSSSVEKLPVEDQQRLRKACMPGQLLLNRYQHPWIIPTLELIYKMDDEKQAYQTPS